MAPDWDIVVLGAGAAGLMAAFRAAELGRACAAAGKEPQARRQNPHVRRHPLQHHPRHRQPRHRRGLRAARPVPPLRPGRPERAGHDRPLRGRRASPPRSRRPAKSSRSATGPSTCSTPCCAACAAAGRRSPSANRSTDLAVDADGLHDRHAAPNGHRAAGHPDDRRPIVPRQRHDRRRLPPRRGVRPHDRAAAAGPGADHDRPPPWVAELRGVTLPDVALRVLQGGQKLTTRRGSLLVRPFRSDRPGRPRREPGRQRPSRSAVAASGDRLAARRCRSRRSTSSCKPRRWRRARNNWQRCWRLTCRIGSPRRC